MKKTKSTKKPKIKLSEASAKSYKKKLLRHQLTICYKIGVAALLIIAVGTIFYFYDMNRVYESYEIKERVERTGVAASNCEILGDKILTYSSDGINCSDKTGKVLWNQTYEMQNPLISTSSNKVAIGDYNGTSIYVMDSENIIGEISTNLPIRNIAISSNGIVAVELNDSDVTWIYIFDSEGNTIANIKTTMQVSGYPMDIAISNDGVLLAVSYQRVESAGMQTEVVFYNLDEVGVNYTDKLVAGYPYEDTVVPILEFMNDKNSFAVGDDKLMIYEGDQIPAIIEPVESAVDSAILIEEEIQDVFHNDKYIGIMFHGTQEGVKSRLDIYDVIGRKVISLNIPIDYKEVLLVDEQIIVYGDLECYIYNMKGTCKFNDRFSEKIVKFIPTESRSEYIYITDDEILTIQMQ